MESDAKNLGNFPINLNKIDLNKSSDNIDTKSNGTLEKINNYEEEKKECRYCLSEGKVLNLITPCACEGSLKYVHQECLEDWIKNSNKVIQEITKNNKKYYVVVCELCKYQIRYFRNYKHNVFESIFKLFKSIFSSLKKTCMFGMHSIVMYFVLKRSSSLMENLLKLVHNENTFNKGEKPSFFMYLFHYLIVFTSMALVSSDILNFYKSMYMEKRKCYIKFLPKS